MKNKIINDILSLRPGTIFTINEYLRKYEIDKKEHLHLTIEILENIQKYIDPVDKLEGDIIPIVGLPQYSKYIKR